jgi:fluoride ion exporter CrcB/FEX
MSGRPTNVGFFAGFTSSSAFRYSVIFIVRSKNFQAMLLLLGLSFSLPWSFQDCGCGKAMLLGGFFRKNRQSGLPAVPFVM